MTESPIIIIGAGPAGLMTAQRLAEAGKEVHVYEQNKAAARKFLVAGHGGFNLTHSEDMAEFILKYDKPQIQHITQSFNNHKTVAWLREIGIETYVGSSGKIFPLKSIKPIHVLHAWLERLTTIGVQIHYEHQFLDYMDNKVSILHKGKIIEKNFSKLILALGGGSWQKTGSDAKWIPILAKKGIQITPLSAANSGYNTIQNFQDIEGQVVKNIEVKFADIRKKGEIVFTKYGIEGSPIYFLNRYTRHFAFPLTIFIDLKPNLTEENLSATLAKANKTSEILKNNLKLNKTAVALLKKLNKEIYNSPTLLAKKIKSFPIEVSSFRPIDEVISTAGGVAFEELHQSLALKKFPNVYCIGEMVDWEAPTGGYLLQACFSMGNYCAERILNINP